MVVRLENMTDWATFPNFNAKTLLNSFENCKNNAVGGAHRPVDALTTSVHDRSNPA